MLCVHILGREPMTIRRYSELIQIPTFKERYDYLKLGDGHIGEDTFGWLRYLNQDFYRSKEWKTLRNHIIVRDLGCDMALDGFTIFGRIYIHHMNPIVPEDIRDQTAFLLDPEYLVCVSYDTHQAIHYGVEERLPKPPTVRTPGDTIFWSRV